MINKYLQNFKSFNTFVHSVHYDYRKPKNLAPMAMAHLPPSFLWSYVVIVSNKRNLHSLYQVTNFQTQPVNVSFPSFQLICPRIVADTFLCWRIYLFLLISKFHEVKNHICKHLSMKLMLFLSHSTEIRNQINFLNHKQNKGKRYQIRSCTNDYLLV